MRSAVTFAIALASAMVTFAPPVLAKEGKKAVTSALVPQGEIKWSDVPDFPGVQMAVLEGDPAKGPAHIMIRFKDGFAAPLHHHSSDHFVTVVSGTLLLTVDGKETRLPAGSFFLFRGRKQHITKCEPGADCVLSLDVRGKWDVVPEESHEHAGAM
jgi:quercetin dioxygenase-like cupin family protein